MGVLNTVMHHADDRKIVRKAIHKIAHRIKDFIGMITTCAVMVRQHDKTRPELVSLRNVVVQGTMQMQIACSFV